MNIYLNDETCALLDELRDDFKLGGAFSKARHYALLMKIGARVWSALFQARNTTNVVKLEVVK